MAHPAYAHLEPDECDSQATDGVFVNTADQDCGTAVSGAALCTNLSTMVNSRLVCAEAWHPLNNPRRADALHTHPGPNERVGWSPSHGPDLRGEVAMHRLPACAAWPTGLILVAFSARIWPRSLASYVGVPFS